MMANFKINYVKEAQFHIGVSMFDPTREHDTNPTRVFSG